MAKTTVKPHSCAHEYQDHKYGQGKRLFNFGWKKPDWHCTVCGATVLANDKEARANNPNHRK